MKISINRLKLSAKKKALKLLDFLPLNLNVQLLIFFGYSIN
jgi:hypothetical protein